MKVEKQIRGIIQTIKEGMVHPSMKGATDPLEARKADLITLLADIPEDAPDLLPSASAIYAKKVSALAAALAKPDERPRAAATLRMLIEKIVLTSGPERGEIFATLHGDLVKTLEWTERQAIGKPSKTARPPQVRRVCRPQWLRGAYNYFKLRSDVHLHSMLLQMKTETLGGLFCTAA